MVDTFLQLSCKALARFLPVDEEKLLKELNDNFMVRREFGMFAGGLCGMFAGGLCAKYGRYMAIASVALLNAKNVEVPMIGDKKKDSLCEETE